MIYSAWASQKDSSYFSNRIIYFMKKKLILSNFQEDKVWTGAFLVLFLKENIQRTLESVFPNS